MCAMKACKSVDLHSNFAPPTFGHIATFGEVQDILAQFASSRISRVFACSIQSLYGREQGDTFRAVCTFRYRITVLEILMEWYCCIATIAGTILLGGIMNLDHNRIDYIPFSLNLWCQV